MGPTASGERLAEWSRMHASKAEALTAFNEAKFGMFIHWGLYAIPGGVWNGQRMEDDGIGPTVAEWIMRRRSIPRARYAELAGDFSPLKFDADEWAQLAADAGMRYMVITSKHHDGFALHESRVSDFTSVAATPFGRDAIAELHDACPRHQVRFGVYYSHTLDWYDGGDFGIQYATETTGLRKIGTNDWDPSPRTFDDYLTNKAMAQVEELAERYSDLFLVWFDGAGYIPEDLSLDFYRAVYRHAPGTLVNSRISNVDLPRDLGDYQSAGDNHIPDLSEVEKPHWETCGTMNNSWGYKSYDHDWKGPVEVLSWLVDVVSRGGNYLLNVGPTGEGEIPAESVRTLRQVGAWLRVNGDAIYGTHAWSVFREGPTESSRKGTGQRAQRGFTATFTPQDLWFTRRDGAVYAIALAYPHDHRVLIRSMKDVPVAKVRMLGTDQAVSWESTPEGLSVSLPTRTSAHGYALGIDLT